MKKIILALALVGVASAASAYEPGHNFGNSWDHCIAAMTTEGHLTIELANLHCAINYVYYDGTW